eukprot:2206430-Rhodomonas_salina.1
MIVSRAAPAHILRVRVCSPPSESSRLTQRPQTRPRPNPPLGLDLEPQTLNHLRFWTLRKSSDPRPSTLDPRPSTLDLNPQLERQTSDA